MSRWERVSELFERALELPAGERAAFLARSCAGDDELRREVESLLAAHGPARTFFDHVESEVVGPAVGRVLDGPEDIAPDTVLGTYEIRSRIGGGGMGVVYSALDRRLNRTVALKLIAPELVHDPAARERLIREARAAAALDDPRIAQVHAIEEVPDGRLFIVMPHYGGETLKQRLARGPLEPREAVEIATELTEGLACAHRAGIVHRDIKPANVLITNDGALKILDFGLAKLATGSGPTRTGVAAGTAAYMAPEQVRGEPADPRSDVWSLGIVLYEMLAGRRPFHGDSDPALIYAVLEKAPEPLRTRVPGLPGPLEELVDRMLSKDPALRPRDAGAATEALRGIGAPPPSREHSDAGALTTGRRQRVTRRAALALAFSGMVAALALLVAYRASSRNPGAGLESNAIAVLPFVVRGDPDLDYLGDGLVHLLSTKLDGVGELHAVDPHALLASFGARDAPPDPAMGRAAAERFDAGAFVLGTALRLGEGIELSASLYGSDGGLQATADAMAKQDADLSGAIDELARELVAHRLTDSDAAADLAGLAAMTTRSLPALRAYLEGERLLRTGRPAAALSALETAVAHDSTFGLAWYRLARAAGWLGSVELNEDAAARAVRYGGALPGRTRALVSAYRVYRIGNPLEAERQYRRVLAGYPGDIEALELLGETLFHNNPFFGRPTAEAREPLEHALAMDPGNREVMVHLMDLAAAGDRPATVDTLTARYVSVEPDDELPTAIHAYAALRSLVLEPPSERERTLTDLAAAGPDAILDALVRVAPHLRDLDLTDRLAEMLTHPSHAPAQRATGHLYRAWTQVARGRWSDAEPQWGAAEAIEPDRTLVYRVLAAALPFSPVSPGELASLRAAVEAWTPGTALEDGLRERDLPAARLYLLGLLAWRAADDVALAHAIRELEGSSDGAPSESPAAAAFGATLEALALWRSDRHAETLAALDRAELRIPFHRRARSPLLEQHLNRFVRAEALRMLGAEGGGGQGATGAESSDADALRWYASLEDGYFQWGAPLLGPALVGVAEIHERQGRPEEAVRAYERFLDLWPDADPEFDGWIELAKGRLDRHRSGS